MKMLEVVLYKQDFIALVASIVKKKIQKAVNAESRREDWQSEFVEANHSWSARST